MVSLLTTKLDGYFGLMQSCCELNPQTLTENIELLLYLKIFIILLPLQLYEIGFSGQIGLIDLFMCATRLQGEIGKKLWVLMQTYHLSTFTSSPERGSHSSKHPVTLKMVVVHIFVYYRPLFLVLHVPVPLESNF